jgi:PfaD family protein
MISTARAAARSQASSFPCLGSFTPGSEAVAFTPDAVLTHAGRFREPCLVIHDSRQERVGVAFGDQGRIQWGERGGPYTLLACLAPVYPEWLGDRSFNEAHGVRFPYVAGEMAQGLATPRMVIEMARAGMLGFFGAAGLPPARIAQALDGIAAGLGGQDLPWGANLIHSPQTPRDEEGTVDLYIKRRVRNVSASAFLKLTRSVVRYSTAGLRSDPSGRVLRDHHVFAKISRPETAEQFLSPPPADMLAALVREGAVTESQARMAATLSVAEDVTVEADSGGHTDNRPLSVVLPLVCGLRDRLVARHGYRRPVRVGAAGGIGTPAAVASAFAMGAAYVLTGSINQSAVESGQSEAGKRLLAEAGMADVAMAPAADMFEMGVKVQVLKRGTLFAMRAQTLYEVYRAHDSLEALPAGVREKLERDIFRSPLEEIYQETLRFWQEREPREAERARSDARHRMALVFRWYLGNASRWARQGTADRQRDYQIWCGPSMGAFNAWARGSFLERPEGRTVVQIARNLLEGAAQITRMQQWRSQGVPVPAAAFDYRPRPLT